MTHVQRWSCDMTNRLPFHVQRMLLYLRIRTNTNMNTLGGSAEAVKSSLGGWHKL
jgi:hypothetical protein